MGALRGARPAAPQARARAHPPHAPFPVGTSSAPLVDGCVDLAVLHILAEKTGRQIRIDAGDEADDAEDRVAELRADPDPRRRIIRVLLDKLDRHGKWFPACSERRAVARGFGGPDVGLALEAVAVLIRAGWLSAEAKRVNESAVGLNSAHRDDIEAMIRTGACSEPVVGGWLHP